jgi:hypothetical protein
MQEQATIDPKRRYLCRHIFTDGHRCGSPAIRRQNFCFYHRAARPAVSMNGRPSYFPMPLIGDRAAIQNAIFEILNRASSGDIQYREAATLLYGLQLASNNLNRIETAIPTTEPLVEETIMDPEGGYMAPITELPDQPATTETSAPEQHTTTAAPTSTARPEPIILNCHSEPKAKNPRIPPESPQHPAPKPQHFPVPPPPQPTTLAAIHATNQVTWNHHETRHRPARPHVRARRIGSNACPRQTASRNPHSRNGLAHRLPQAP